MYRLLLSTTVAIVLLSGCTTAPSSTALVSESAWLTPEQAVIKAAEAAPAGVPGTFAMKVRATGIQGTTAYLNSESDYRDQRNLTIALNAAATQQLARRLGADPLGALTGRDILVRGSAIRTKIHFFANGQVTNKYYYQTHVNVSNGDQIVLR